ncbi:hypothetical protein KX816_08865 [Sphingosinicellaceae bacterium]|nr:hypothetical protein KX816_08865 [Sphingosinicellaceae bacterium]
MNIAASLPALSTDVAIPGVAPTATAEFPVLFAALVSAPVPISTSVPLPIPTPPTAISLPVNIVPAELDAGAKPQPGHDDPDADADVDPDVLPTPVADLLLLAVPAIAVLLIGSPATSIEPKPSAIAIPVDVPSVSPFVRTAASPPPASGETATLQTVFARPRSRLPVRAAEAIVAGALELARPTAKLEPRLLATPAPAEPPAQPVIGGPAGVPVAAPDLVPQPVTVQQTTTELSPVAPAVTAPSGLPVATPAPAATAIAVTAGPVAASPATVSVTPVPTSETRATTSQMSRPLRSRDQPTDLALPQSTPAFATSEAPHDVAPSLATTAPRATGHDPAPFPITAHIVDTGPGSFDLATDRLGAVRVAIEARDTRVGVQFTVDTSAAASLLGAQPSRLADAVATSGNSFDGVSVDVRSGGGNANANASEGGGGGGRPPAERRDPARTAALEPRPLPRALRADRYA